MKKLTHAVLLAGVVTIGVSTAALAADEPPPPAPAADAAKPAEPAKPTGPTLGDVLGASGISITGYVDAAYEHLSSTGAFTSGVANRVFDFEPSSFNLHQAAITIAKQPTEGFGALVNLTAGKDADVIHSFNQTSSNFDLTQAFVQYATGPLTLIGGKFVTLAGAEVINSTQDTNYSRSILFGYAIPFTHTGARATFAASDVVSVIVGINNGWDQLKDENKQKTVELGVSVTPNKVFSMSAQGYSGKEQVSGPFDPIGGTRNLIDLVGTVNATDQLTFILNYDYGTQDNATSLVNGSTIKAKWTGLAAYVNLQLAEQWRLSLRGEYFDDKDGYRTGVIQKWKEATLTLAFLPTKNAEIRAEVRGDKSNHNSFLQSDGTGKDTQSSVGLEAIYKF
jgi:hypothetical protein